MVQARLLLSTLLFNTILVQSESGSLDDTSVSYTANESNGDDSTTGSPSTDNSEESLQNANNENAAQSIAAAVSLPAASAVSPLASTTTAIVNSNNAQNSQQYAVNPSTTVITTNAQGQTTTQYLWYVGSNAVESNTANSNKGRTSISTTATAGTLSAASTKTTEGPLTTVVGTYSNGVEYTSVLWWLPSTTYTESGSHVTTTLQSDMSESITKSNSDSATTTTGKKTKTTKSKSSTHSISSYHNSTNVANKLSKNAIGLAAVMLLL